MGKIPVRMKAVIYSLSPFQQQVMSGLWKDLPHKLTKKVSENWISASLLIGPLLGTHLYVQNYLEREKQHHSTATIAAANAVIILASVDKLGDNSFKRDRNNFRLLTTVSFYPQ
ncbi:hypothetical protein C5167_005366 [Papaver somniferum]|uniref:Cytochrome b-c1 complex subunit 8 n=1 Tax=Papaver somniferum TaxID=3469 RepID=A0A4Y7JAC9_PAPSO|nr:hypothetical protein C5167_005366 [Papaver somniferum]